MSNIPSGVPDPSDVPEVAMKECPECEGTGQLAVCCPECGHECYRGCKVTCDTCNGTGQVEDEDYQPPDEYDHDQEEADRQ